MNLILWRHAEAHDTAASGNDLDRTLTARGEKQAKRMGQWLDRQLPDITRILVSPARRTEQTAIALGRNYKIRAELAPGCTAAQLLELVSWPDEKATVLVVGHQPTLGQVIAQRLELKSSDCAVKRGAVWWLRSRERDGLLQTVVVTVHSPEVL